MSLLYYLNFPLVLQYFIFFFQYLKGIQMFVLCNLTVTFSGISPNMWYILTWLNSAPVWAEIISLMCPINFQFPRQLTCLKERERRKMPIKIWIFNLSIQLRFIYTHLNILQLIWNVIRYAYVVISTFIYLYISDYVYFGSADLNWVRQVCFLRLCGNLFPLLIVVFLFFVAYC